MKTIRTRDNDRNACAELTPRGIVRGEGGDVPISRSTLLRFVFVGVIFYLLLLPIICMQKL